MRISTDKMRKLMIVGASVLQLPAIKKAKEMGLEVAVVDYNPQAVGISYADKYYNASTMDEGAVVRAAEDYRPDGILTLASDMPMRGVAKSSEKLGLHSISYETAVMATDKYHMIKAFEANNVPCSWYFLVENKDQLRSLEDKLTYPCIMKPTDNSGSHGVVEVNSFADLMRLYEYSHSCSRRGAVIVEEYLDGPEVSVEVMVIDGKVNVLQITDKLTTGAPFFVELGHSQPSMLPEDVKEQIRDVACRACQAVGINMGPAHVEIKVTKDGPKMIELGARMSGDNITTSLVPLSTGIDMVKATIQLALGEPADIQKTIDCGSAIRYFQLPFGTIRSITGIGAASSLEGVRDIIFTRNIGDKSTMIQSSNDRVGSVIAQAATADEAVRICEEAMRMVNIEID